MWQSDRSNTSIFCNQRVNSLMIHGGKDADTQILATEDQIDQLTRRALN